MKTGKTGKTDGATEERLHRRGTLHAIFAPKTVAVIGATEKEGSVGRTIIWNLINTQFGGTIFPVNPKRPRVLGIKTYPDIASVPERVDLVVVVIPAPAVPSVIGECVDAGVKGAIIISAGFKETGEEGIKLEQQVLAEARRGHMRIIGPNCLGVMSPLTGLNATFASNMARPGSVGFVSQSGALCTAVLDWSLKDNVGFSAFVSIGSMLDVDWGDLIYYLGDDPRTKSIVIYMESIGNARSFLSASREVSYTKPIIVIKAGRTEAAAKAASSHTGSLTGSDEVLDAAFRRSGVLRVEHMHELFYMAEVLGKQPRPHGCRLTILTNAGGPGVLATDSLVSKGGKLAELSDETIHALDEFLPAHWSHGNPVDILGDASPERYAKALEVTAIDPNSDGLLVILTPQAMTDPTRTAEALKPLAHTTGKPVLASWMGGPDVAAGQSILNRANIPTFSYPDTAARMFYYMWRYSYNLKGLYETPEMPDDSAGSLRGRASARTVIDAARREKRTVLTEHESKEILAAYGIPVVATKVATTPLQAVQAAEEIGFPVVLKLYSETITHKTDVGGVILNIKTLEAVQDAYESIASSTRQKVGKEHFLGVTVQPMVKSEGYELIIGSSVDPQFGPVLLFGLGGQLVEVFGDRSLALPPLNTTLARRMIEQTKIYTALQGVRGRQAVDLGELERLLVTFSQLVMEQRWIKEIDINPLLASPDQLLALDARVLLHDADTLEEQLPQPAIRPYPNQYVQQFQVREGGKVTFRPIRPEDEPLLVKFHEGLSERSVYLRYMHMVKLSQRVSHERLCRICFIDYDAGMVLVAEREIPESREHEILGVGRLNQIHGMEEAEFAVIVRDDWQQRGLGTGFIDLLLRIAKDEGIHRVTAEILQENHYMQALCERAGFTVQGGLGDEVVRAFIDL